MLVAMLACACFSWAQSGEATAATPAAPSFRIAGTLVIAGTGDPVQGAVVSALDSEQTRRVASAETAADGSFALEGLSAAKYPLMASKRGYATGYYMQHGVYSSAVVTGPGEESEHLVFQLGPAAVIHGVVTADGGDPVEGATVLLFAKPRGNEPSARIELAGGVATDDTGAYEFAHLEAGTYYVVVQAKPWYAIHRVIASTQAVSSTDAGSALDVAYPITYYDSTTDETSASPIALAAGSRVEANIDLHAVPALHLKIQAPRKADGTFAIPKLDESLFGVAIPGGDEAQEPVVHIGAGIMEVDGLAPGQYELTQGDPPRVAEFDAESSEIVDPSLGTPATKVTGTLVNAAGAPLSGDARLILTPAETKASRSAMSARIEQGSFTFTPVTPGIWTLTVVLGEHELPVESITVGRRKFDGNRFTVAEQPLTLKVTVEEKPLRVNGIVKTGGKGVAGVMVVAVPKNGALFPALARRDQSDSDGSFSLRDVAPGAYTVVAIENAWDNFDWSRSEVIGRYLSGGVEITVAGGQEARVKVSEPVPVQPK
jgi:hypothetical protein